MAHSNKYAWRVAGFIFKAICSLFIIAVIGLLLWRIIDSSNDGKEMNTVVPNRKLCDAYNENDGKLTLFTQEQTMFTRDEHNSGYFAITQSLFIKEADQLQFVFRYNNSTLKYTKEDYSLPEQPGRDEDVYDVSIVVIYDLTPDNKDDNNDENTDTYRAVRYYPSQCVPHTKTLYNYRKFVFDEISITDDVIVVYADIYYCGDIDYEDDAYGTLRLYHWQDENISRDLSSDDIKAISNWSK